MEEHVSVLRTDNLVKRYGPRTVADHVSIDVRQGEIVGLLGPNGAGKTTTFYMTTGLVTPNEGRIFLDDQEITKLPVYRRAKLGIGYLAQEASVYRKMSVEDNLRATLEMTPMTPEEQRDKLESLIAEFRLQKVRKNLGDRLSGGERRRCEIARCLAISPKFIMLDEPFAGVDPIAVEDIQLVGAAECINDIEILVRKFLLGNLLHSIPNLLSHGVVVVLVAFCSPPNVVVALVVIYDILVLRRTAGKDTSHYVHSTKLSLLTLLITSEGGIGLSLEQLFVGRIVSNHGRTRDTILAA